MSILKSKMIFKSITVREIILFGTCLFLSYFLFIKGCTNQKDIDELIKNISNYKDSAQLYKLKVNGGLVDVSFNNSVILENERQLKILFAQNDTILKQLSKFKKATSTTVINQYTTIHNDTIPGKKDAEGSETLTFEKYSEHYQLKASFPLGHNYFIIDTLVIPNTQSILIGEKKLGFLKGTEKRIEIINSNPLIKTNTIKNYVIQHRKKWYETRGFMLGAGILVGSVGLGQLKK